MATLTPQNPKPKAPPPGAQAVAEHLFQELLSWEQVQALHPASASGPEALCSPPPPPGWSMNSPLGPPTTWLRAELRHPALLSSSFLRVF